MEGSPARFSKDLNEQEAFNKSPNNGETNDNNFDSLE